MLVAHVISERHHRHPACSGPRGRGTEHAWGCCAAYIDEYHVTGPQPTVRSTRMESRKLLLAARCAFSYTLYTMVRSAHCVPFLVPPHAGAALGNSFVGITARYVLQGLCGALDTQAAQVGTHMCWHVY